MTTEQNQAQQPEFSIQRIYVKDLSFESPQTPALFQEEWKPDLNLQIQTNTNRLADDTHEVILKLIITVKSADKTAFLIEVQQAGIFTLQRFPEQQLHAMLGSVCPSILFPYAREVVTDLASRGTFPPLYLAPVNFEALYAQHVAQQQNQASTPETSSIIQ